MTEAIEAVNEIEANYEKHAQAARDVAESYFDSKKVHTKLIEEVMVNDTEYFSL